MVFLTSNFENNKVNKKIINSCSYCLFSQILIPISPDGAVQGCLVIMFGCTERQTDVTISQDLKWERISVALLKKGPTEIVFLPAAKEVQAAVMALFYQAIKYPQVPSQFHSTEDGKDDPTLVTAFFSLFPCQKKVAAAKDDEGASQRVFFSPQLPS